VEALQEEITRTGATPLSLLLAELEDADRVLAVETEAGAAGTFGAFARALRGVVRRQDILVCETESRAWIIARDTGRGGAQALGSRVASAVRDGEPWRGAPLVASVGISVLGEDGRTPSELIEAAEEARFAAAASGVDVLHAVREDPRGEDPRGDD
jgi:GGDEF domain-containing protein